MTRVWHSFVQMTCRTFIPQRTCPKHIDISRTPKLPKRSRHGGPQNGPTGAHRGPRGGQSAERPQKGPERREAPERVSEALERCREATERTQRSHREAQRDPREVPGTPQRDGREAREAPQRARRGPERPQRVPERPQTPLDSVPEEVPAIPRLDARLARNGASSVSVSARCCVWICCNPDGCPGTFLSCGGGSGRALLACERCRCGLAGPGWWCVFQVLGDDGPHTCRNWHRPAVYAFDAWCSDCPRPGPRSHSMAS